MGTFAPARRWLRRAAAVLVCVLFSLSLTAYGQDTGKTVRVGWFESSFYTTDKSGRRSGYAYEYQQKLAAYSGWRYEYVEGSWTELMEMLKRGEIDLLGDVSYTRERSAQMYFSTLPMGTEEYWLFVAQGSREITPDHTASLNGRRVGVNKDSVQADFFRQWAQENEVEAELVELTGTEEESMELLQRGELDAYVTVDAFGDDTICMPVWKIGSSDFFFAVSRSREDLLLELDSAMSRVQDEDRYYNLQLYKKYMSSTGANVFLSDEEKTWLDRHGPIRVAYQDDYLAFCDEADGVLTGALKDYLALAADCLGNAHLTFETVAYPTAEAALEAVQTGAADCMFPASLKDTDGEALGVLLTPQVMRSEVYAVVRSSDKTGFSDRTQVRVATIADNLNYKPLMLDSFPDWQRLEYGDVLSCFRAVSTGAADCLLISSYRYNSLSAICNRFRLTPLTTGVTMHHSFAVSRGSTELYGILARTTGLVSESAVNAALTHYSAEDAHISLSDFIRSNPAMVVAVAVVMLALVGLNISVMRALRMERAAKERERQVLSLNRQVFVDALTHVRNKAAYAQWEEKVNEEIRQGQQPPFAVVVCDVNNLKAVNDLYGHKEGDACIKNACAKICTVFAHSPVFRVGGDEFVVFLSGEDYYRRKALMEQIHEVPRERSKIRLGETVAAGLAEYDPQRHEALVQVFEAADKAMYQRKQYMKEHILPDVDRPEGVADSEYIPVIHTRKRILIADDIALNREMMGDLLQEDYDLLYAADGVETLEVLREHKNEVDLLLLDLQMPNMDGREVIARMHLDEDLMSIPVVFLTVDQKAELDCLRIGAMDFIPKPYPDIEIVKARIAKCIELSEDRDLIRYTERDKLTGLLNKDYFYRYVTRMDHLQQGSGMDALVCDVNRFHALNQQYGRQFGDRVLRSIGAGMKHLARTTGGIVSRERGDCFLLYCPHQVDWEPLLHDFRTQVLSEGELSERVRLRFGVFPNAQQEADLEERFGRAKIGADRVKDEEGQECGFYP